MLTITKLLFLSLVFVGSTWAQVTPPTPGGGGALPANIKAQSVALVPGAPVCTRVSVAGPDTWIYSIVGFNVANRNTVATSCTVTGVDNTNYDIDITLPSTTGIIQYSIYRLQSAGVTTGLLNNGWSPGDMFEDAVSFYIGNGTLPPPANDTGLTSAVGLTVTGGLHLPLSWTSGMSLVGVTNNPMGLDNSASTSTPIYISFIYDADSNKYLSGTASIGNSLSAEAGPIDTPNLYGFVLDPYNPGGQTLNRGGTTFVKIGSNGSTLADLTGAYTLVLFYQSALDNFGGKNAASGYFGTCNDSTCLTSTQIEPIHQDDDRVPFMFGVAANGAVDPSVTQLWTSPQAFILPHAAGAVANLTVGGPDQANGTNLLLVRPSQGDTPMTSPALWGIKQTSSANPFGARFDQRIALGLNPDLTVAGEPQWTLNWEDKYCPSVACQTEIYITVQSPNGTNLFRPLGWTIPYNNTPPSMELGQDIFSFQNAIRSWICFTYDSSLGLTMQHPGCAFRGPVVAPTLQVTTIYSVAGTPLPTCNTGAKGTEAIVSDATVPTFLGAYTGSGAVNSPVLCNGTTWVTY